MSNTYLCIYNGKRREVMAERTIDAQEAAAVYFKCKKAYKVAVYLLAKDGEGVTHDTAAL